MPVLHVPDEGVDQLGLAPDGRVPVKPRVLARPLSLRPSRHDGLSVRVAHVERKDLIVACSRALLEAAVDAM